MRFWTSACRNRSGTAAFQIKHGMTTGPQTLQQDGRWHKGTVGPRIFVAHPAPVGGGGSKNRGIAPAWVLIPHESLVFLGFNHSERARYRRPPRIVKPLAAPYSKDHLRIRGIPEQNLVAWILLFLMTLISLFSRVLAEKPQLSILSPSTFPVHSTICFLIRSSSCPESFSIGELIYHWQLGMDWNDFPAYGTDCLLRIMYQAP